MRRTLGVIFLSAAMLGLSDRDDGARLTLVFRPRWDGYRGFFVIFLLEVREACLYDFGLFRTSVLLANSAFSRCAALSCTRSDGLRGSDVRDVGPAM